MNADLIESTFRLKVESQTANFFATYGVTDKLDVAVAIPFQYVKVDATVTSVLVRFPGSNGIAAIADSASGVGDIALRAKYNVLNRSGGALAGGVDLRLPTGDEANLLGTGTTRLNVYGAVSSGVSRLFPHANFGYTFSSSDDSMFVFSSSSEFNYTVGAEVVVGQRLTIVGDLIGRSVEEGRLELASKSLLLQDFTRSGGPAGGIWTYSELTFDFDSPRLNQALGVIGAKWNPGATFIISGHLLFSLTDAGIKSRVTPVIGVDYTS